MSVSTREAMAVLRDNEKLSLNDMGFVTTVFRDDAPTENIAKYYQAVLDMIIEKKECEKNGG